MFGNSSREIYSVYRNVEDQVNEAEDCSVGEEVREQLVDHTEWITGDQGTEYGEEAD